MNFGLKALACLLLYPDAALKDNLPEIKEGVGGSSLSDDQKDKLYIFINHLAETPLSDLQKDYVSTFDIGKKASLNLLSICTEIRVREVLRCSILKSSTKNEA